MDALCRFFAASLVGLACQASAAVTVGSGSELVAAVAAANTGGDPEILLSDGVYPFSRYDAGLADVPSGDSPFTFRIISHCTDLLQHGLTPGVHEPTFQISLSGDGDGDSDSDSDSD